MQFSDKFHRELDIVVRLMRELSRQTDPDEAAELYRQGVQELNLVPNDRYMAISRRGLSYPQYRMTRNSSWKEHPNPWAEKHKLPLYSGGMLAEMLYSNKPAVIDDLPTRVAKDDPVYEWLHDMQVMITMPHFDGGESLNMGLLLCKQCDAFPYEQIPLMIWQANLWGRATLNLVNTQKLRQAYEAMDRELRIVADIQRSLLPRTMPAIPGLDMASHYQTSQRAGGDYFDFFPLAGGRWGILLADVSGHGTPAAVLMAITHAIAHTKPGDPQPPAELLGFVNQTLCRHYTTNNGNFVTGIYLVYEPERRKLVYAVAGHPPPRLVRDGRVLGLEGETSYPLGVDARETFREHSLELLPGDRLVLYTDGVPDTFNAEGESFGAERLDRACLTEAADAADLLRRLLAAMDAFAAGTPPSDDRTMLAVRVV